MYALLADIVVILHALFIAFVVLGQFVIMAGWSFGWQWTRNLAFRIIHLLAIGFVVIQAWLGVVCPLTTLEYELRIRAGQTPHEMSFIGYWLNRLLYYTAAEWVFTLVYTFFAMIVVVVFCFYPPKKINRNN